MDKKKLFEFAFGLPFGEMPRDIIVTPFIPLKRFQEQCRPVRRFKGRLYEGFTGSNNGSSFGVVRCGIGDRLLGDAILLLEGSGATRVIFAGSCGGLAEVEIGDLIVCDRALDGEGFTRHFRRGSDISSVLEDAQWVSPDKDLSETCAKIIYEKTPAGIKCKKGPMFTTGSLLVETEGNIKKLSESGFAGIEMELSAVYAAALSAGIKAASILFVSDRPGDKPLWEPLSRKDKDSYNRGLRELVRMVVECITS